MIISYAINDGKIVSANNKTNSQYNKWLARNNQFTIVDVNTENDQFCNTGNLKVENGAVVLKTEDDYRLERIAKAGDSIPELYRACTSYQKEGAKPRIDSNFFALLIQSQGLKKINPALAIPKCDANIAWNNALWADYDQRKIDIENGDVVNLDFTNNGNPPYTWDECYSELMS